MQNIKIGDSTEFLISDGHIIIQAPEILKNQIFYARNGKDFQDANLLDIWTNSQNLSTAKYTSLKMQFGADLAAIISSEKDISFVNQKFIDLAGDICEVRAGNGREPVFFRGQIDLFALPILCGNKNFETSREYVINILEDACKNAVL